MPKVSVCMVTYNHENFIREAIMGVLMQETDFEVELVIGNDCSQDGTDGIIAEILETHPKATQIKYFNHGSNKGMMANFAFIMQACSGDYMALCDGDDYWTDPRKLQKQTDFLEHNPAYALCFHKVAMLMQDGTLAPDNITQLPEQHETLEALLRYGNYIHTPSVVLRKINQPLPNEFFDSPVGDFFVYVMAAMRGKIKYFPEVMSVYRYNVGFFSLQKGMGNSVNIIRFYSCLLSYLNDADLKKIIFDRQLLALTSFAKNAENKFSSNRFLASRKSFADVLKILAAKILKKDKI